MATTTADDSALLGVVLLIRHGDRLEFFQDPLTYTTSDTAITPLGNVEELRVGAELRQLYMNESSPSFIQNISTGLLVQDQVEVRADSGDEGFVIFDSAVSLLQGLFPPLPANNITLSNGTVIEAPFGGYQYVPIDSVELDTDISLEAWVDCGPFNAATSQFYNSSVFQEVSQQAQPFLDSLPPIVGNRSTSLINIFNIFDFINVQSIHNASFAAALPNGTLAQARALANFHEYGVFTGPTNDAIGNIGGRAILPSVVNYMQRIANSSDPLKLAYQAISYKPFLSLFNMTGVAQTYPQLAGIVDYASVAAYEVRQPASGGEPVIRFNFRNGTANGTETTTFATYNMLGASGDIPLSQFAATFAPVEVNSTQQWCGVCHNTMDRGCDALALANASRMAVASGHHDKISPVGAGFLGAGLTAAVFLMALCALAFFGVLTFRHKAKGGSSGSDTAINRRSDEKA